MMSRIFYFFLLFSFLGFFSCSKKIQENNLRSSSDIEQYITKTSTKKQSCNCNDPLNYIPNEELPQLEDFKYVRLNFHFPNTTDKRYNFHGETAANYAQALVESGNNKLRDNKKMRLPIGNNTPVLDPGYRYVMALDESTPSGLAVYEALDDENWNYVKRGKLKNNHDRTLIKKFARYDDSILNVFAMGYHPDSIVKEGYPHGRAGIALGTSIKVAGILEHGKGQAWKMTSLLNHEIGHVLGLSHSWYKNDGCDDTPPNPNCWSRSGSGACSQDENLSNNFMDYNNIQMAITPCQIGKVRVSMHKQKHRVRDLIVRDWCTYEPNKSIVVNVNDSLAIDRAIDMKGDIIVREDAILRLSCRVHMPHKAKIILHPGAKLILNGAKLHNDCGETWGGIQVMSRGDKSASIEKYGRIYIEDLADEIVEEQ